MKTEFIPEDARLAYSDVAGAERGTRLWVINVAETRDGIPSDVSITVRHADGQTTALSIPHANLAVDVTSMAPIAALLSSTHFIRATQTGSLQLVKDEYAEWLNSQPEAVMERARLHQIEQSLVSARYDMRSDTPTTDERIEVVRKAPLGQIPVQVTMAPSQEVSTGPLNLDGLADSVVSTALGASFLTWFGGWNILALPEAAASLQKRGQLSRAEAQYIVKHTQHDRIRDFLKDKML